LTTTSRNGFLPLIPRLIGIPLSLNGKKVQETGSFRLKLSRSGNHLAENLFSGFTVNVRLLLQFASGDTHELERQLEVARP
jgi:hypothetical protein